MSENPINLGLRFLLELAALFVMGFWGWQVGGESLLRFVFALAVPLAAAALWGTFRVPGDPGNGLVAVPGLIRLTLEFSCFSFAVWALLSIGKPAWGWALGTVVLFHYLISYDRLLWLLGIKHS